MQFLNANKFSVLIKQEFGHVKEGSAKDKINGD